MESKIYTAEEAIKKFVKDGDFVTIGGFGQCCTAAETLITLHDMYMETGFPKNLTVMCGGGNPSLDNFGEEGLVKRVIVGHYGPNKKIIDLVSENKIESYNLPQGLVSHLLRAVVNREVGLITKIGLNTCMDPRLNGAKMNDVTTEDMVELVDILGEEYLVYKCPQIDVAIIRGTVADEDGNISFIDEPVQAYAKMACMAAKACGGKVIVEVRDIVAAGQIPPRDVDVAGIFVDAIVQIKDPDAHYRQYSDGVYNRAYLGYYRVPTTVGKPLALDARKLIARRAAMELVPHSIVNLGLGIPEGVASIAQEEGCIDDVKMTLEAGFIGGYGFPRKPLSIHVNHDAVNDEPTQFDFYHSGMLDVACLGFAQINAAGDVNVSKIGNKVNGCGGFPDIAQCSKTVVFCGTFTAGGLREEVADGKLAITQEGRNKKFMKDLLMVSFSGKQALKDGVRVLYVTDRCVFELREQGLVLTEIAPGVDLQKDILDQMEFEPVIAEDLKTMNEKLFFEANFGLKELLAAKAE